MGVKDLWEILSPVKEEVKSIDLRGKTLAVDLSSWVVAAQAFKFNGSPPRKAHLRNVFFKTSSLLRSGVQPIAVVDGAAPDSKMFTLQQRSKTLKGKRCSMAKLMKKQQRPRFRERLGECVELLESLGVPCIQSPSEAEATCAWLEINKVADGCITQDSDVFLYGASNVYRNLSVKSLNVEADYYSMAHIMEELQLDRDKLICLALLLGCDFIPGGVEGVGKEMALDLLDSLSCNKPLDRFISWRNNEELKQIEKNVPLNKKIHCNRCKHPGSEESHQKTPCSLCNASSACDFHSSEYICPCEWHTKKRECEPYEKELKVRCRALKDPNFPSEEVIGEFLECKYAEPVDIKHPERPDASAAIKILNYQLGWTYSDCIRRVLPLLTIWDISHNKEEKRLVPARLSKQRSLQGQKYFEVEWNSNAIAELWNQGSEESKVSHTTLERYDAIALAYPELVEEFRCSKGSKMESDKSCKNVSKRLKFSLESSDEEDSGINTSNDDSENSFAQPLTMTLRRKKCTSYKEDDDSS